MAGCLTFVIIRLKFEPQSPGLLFIMQQQNLDLFLHLYTWYMTNGSAQTLELSILVCLFISIVCLLSKVEIIHTYL